MVHRRRDRPNEGYRVWVTLPLPWGRVGPWQTGLKRKQQAQAVEAWVVEMALTKPELINGLDAGKFTLQDAWVAKLRDDALIAQKQQPVNVDALIGGKADPLLADAVEEYRPQCKDERTRAGLDQILKYAEPKVRLSWLRGNNINAVYAKALAPYEVNGKTRERKPNSVRRSLHRAVTELLAHHLKPKGRDAAFEGVNVPGEDDTRVVDVRPEEVTRLLECCESDDLRRYVIAGITTAIDRAPLLRMTPRLIDEAEGTVGVRDRKTTSRPRLLKVSDVAMSAFLIQARGKELDEPLWPWPIGTVRHAYDRARKAAKLEGLRFKDLRHVLPTLMAAAKVDRREIQAYIGHAQGSKQTDRYITPTGDVAILNAAAGKLGLTNVNLKVG